MPERNLNLIFYCSASDHNEKYMEALAMVSHTGVVFWPPIVKFRSSCLMDMTYFPFDDQICKLKLGSWAYTGFQVDVLNRSNTVDLSRFVQNGEWELIRTYGVRNNVYYTCCPEPFPDVTITLHIRRRTIYYMYNVIIPSIMLSSLALLGFWINPDSGEKVTLGLTVLLALSVFMLLIAENTPATSFFIPLLGTIKNHHRNVSKITDPFFNIHGHTYLTILFVITTVPLQIPCSCINETLLLP